MIKKPLAIDLFCGLGGWTEGLLAEGWDVIGFDIERHAYGDHRYPSRLVLQDVRTINGAQFRDASLIVASSPCQEFSYRAMPWKRAKELGPPLLGMELFAQAERIQREAIAAAGRFIPMIQENVRGAQKYVGRARWHYGSYYLWGDVPALMPMTMRVPRGTRREVEGLYAAGRVLADHIKVGDRNKGRGEDKHLWTTGWNVQAVRDMKEDESRKNNGGSWFNISHNTTSGKRHNPVHDEAHANGVKGFTPHGQPLGKNELGRKHGSKSNARKAASARIAKIPLPLARHIARVYYPR